MFVFVAAKIILTAAPANEVELAPGSVCPEVSSTDSKPLSEGLSLLIYGKALWWNLDDVYGSIDCWWP